VDKRLALTYNLTSPAQLFELYPPEGVPSAAATYSVWAGYRGDDEDAEFSGTATADTYSQAVATASGYTQTNRRRVNVAVTAGLVVGRLYRIENADGQSEVFKATAISLNAYVEAEYDLAYDYLSATATLKGFRQTFSPPNVFVQDESKLNAEAYPYRLRWDYTVGGVARRFFQYFDLLRHEPRDGVGDEDLKDAWPDIAYLMEATRRDRVLGEARAQLDTDLRLRGVDPAELAQQPVHAQLVKQCFAMLAVQSGAAVPQGFDAPTALRNYQRAYLNALELAVAGGKLPRTQNRGDDNVNAQPSQRLLFSS
jgi:hypothetical protein